MFSDVVLHPVFLGTILCVSVVIVRGLIVRGSAAASVYRAVRAHITAMGRINVDAAWAGLSFDLKTRLTEKKRIKKGKQFIGSKRVESYANAFVNLYRDGQLVIDTIHHVHGAAKPKLMYMVRLRSKRSGYMRMTIWVSMVPYRDDGWSIEEVCVHPNDGDLTKGDTLTGVRMKPSKLIQAMRKRHKQRKMKRSPQPQAA